VNIREDKEFSQCDSFIHFRHPTFPVGQPAIVYLVPRGLDQRDFLSAVRLKPDPLHRKTKRRKESNQSFGFTRDLRLPDNLALRVTSLPSLCAQRRINTGAAPRRARRRGDRRVEDRLERSNWRSKTKRTASLRGVYRNGWKRRPFGFKRKGQRGDPDTIPSAGDQPVAGDDGADSQGQQDNDSESPQATQSAILFPFPN